MAKESFSDHFRKLSRAEAAGLEDHPEAEELLAYHDGRLGEVRGKQVQAHLALCAECAGTILDLGTFPGVELRACGHERTQADQEADWLAVERRLVREVPGGHQEALYPAEQPSASPASTLSFPPPSSRSHWPKAVAAVFLATTVALLAQRYLEPEPGGGELATPRANLYFEELLPVDESTTRSDSSAKVSLPAQASSLVLILTTESFREYMTYEAVITGGSDGRRWRLEGLARARDGSFSVDLPRSLLTAGTYWLELNALDDGTPSQIARYHFDLELE